MPARAPRASQMQRVFKRQKSMAGAALANGDAPAAPYGEVDPHHHQQFYHKQPAHTPQQHHRAPPAMDDMNSRCYTVFLSVTNEIPVKELLYGIPARDVWFKPVHVTFPPSAAEYQR